jgi:3-oxoacyl-[acyl-carrier-protein] synthase-3
MQYAAIGPIAVHLPEMIEDNDLLAAEFPKWNMEMICAKTGIRARHIAAEDECASDLGVAAAEKLFSRYQIDRSSIDFLLFCTQTPDYPLPTTACMMQDRLGLPTSIGALDFNLGCSGFVYGLSLADGLIRSGAARRVLLVTAETYSKYIHATDRSLRTIFGDGAAATLIEAADEPSLGPFVFGTDGRGADSLMVAQGGARPSTHALQPRKRKRWPSALYMDGPELVKFTLEVVPPLVEQLLESARWSRDRVDIYLMHQATTFMLDHLRTRLKLDENQIPAALQEYGNTVSSTIPLLMHDLRACGRLRPGTRTLMIGFGVGFSWAGCAWTETWQPQQVQGGRHQAAGANSPGGDGKPVSDSPPQQAAKQVDAEKPAVRRC